MKKITERIIINTLAAAISVCGITGCSSLQQDIVASYIPTEENSEISNFEFRLANIDATYSFSLDTLSTTDLSERNAACDSLIKEITKSISKHEWVNASRARLKAIEGRLHLIMGRKDKAILASEASNEYYKNDIQNIILMHRLKSIADLSSASYSKADKPMILLEQALDFYNQKDYVSSVAKFDEAFISIESFYIDAYTTIRNHAWELRSIKDESVLSSLLTVKQISVSQMMLITQENNTIIEFYNGEKHFSESNLFYRLVQKGLITPATKENPPRNIYSYTKVSRAMQARFLWNIYCDMKNKPALKIRYSSNYGTSGKSSPIKDVNTSNEDFDAILGCIEYGFMNLTDGINFDPSAMVSGIEFNESLEKLVKKINKYFSL